MDVLKELIDKGWTRRAIYTDHRLKVTRQTLYRWETKQQPIPTAKEFVLKFLLEEEVPKRVKPGPKRR